jgi:predicted membrane protein
VSPARLLFLLFYIHAGDILCYLNGRSGASKKSSFTLIMGSRATNFTAFFALFFKTLYYLLLLLTVITYCYYLIFSQMLVTKTKKRWIKWILFEQGMRPLQGIPMRVMHSLKMHKHLHRHSFIIPLISKPTIKQGLSIHV